MEAIDILYPLGLIAVGFLVLYLKIQEQKKAFDSKLTEALRTANGWNSQTNKTVTEFMDDLLSLHNINADAITKLRDETPRLEINEQNEAVLYTRLGKEIHNYQLEKKKK